MQKIILASNSPRRKKILGEAGYKFNIVPSNVSEDIYENNPHKFTQELSKRKAKAIAAKVVVKRLLDLLILSVKLILFSSSIL